MKKYSGDADKPPFTKGDKVMRNGVHGEVYGLEHSGELRVVVKVPGKQAMPVWPARETQLDTIDAEEVPVTKYIK